MLLLFFSYILLFFHLLHFFFLLLYFSSLSFPIFLLYPFICYKFLLFFLFLAFLLSLFSVFLLSLFIFLLLFIFFCHIFVCCSISLDTSYSFSFFLSFASAQFLAQHIIFYCSFILSSSDIICSVCTKILFSFFFTSSSSHPVHRYSLSSFLLSLLFFYFLYSYHLTLVRFLVFSSFFFYIYFPHLHFSPYKLVYISFLLSFLFFRSSNRSSYLSSFSYSRHLHFPPYKVIHIFFFLFSFPSSHSYHHFIPISFLTHVIWISSPYKVISRLLITLLHPFLTFHRNFASPYGNNIFHPQPDHVLDSRSPKCLPCCTPTHGKERCELFKNLLLFYYRYRRVPCYCYRLLCSYPTKG